MSVFRKIIANVLLLGILVGIVPVQTHAADASPSVYNLKLNLLEEPYGVPRDDLACSWAISDSDRDEKRTAYRIVIAKTRDGAVSGNGSTFDSGWIASNKSSGAKISPSLDANALYYWSVQIKDKDGNR